ncbi:MAG: DUF111 family protein, partial [Candidatus Omnitrophica bacterium]|nr:DUF111 family protein [Candidatus Omnitrophota bacterium]
MKIAYFDCFSGISGDMILASLLDAGVNFSDFKKELQGLRLGGFSLIKRNVIRREIRASQISLVAKEKSAYSYLEFLKIIKESSLPKEIKKKAVAAFKDLAWAEKKVHGVKEKDFHFEQLGEIDTLIDICGTFIALDLLGIEEAYFSRVKTARGGSFKHDGTDFPLPGPAVLELLQNIPLELTDEPFEYVTPTGAALVRNL